MEQHYIHGVSEAEQERLRLLNDLLNPSCLQELSIKPGMRILDVGCGTGIFAAEMAKMVGPTGLVLGIEQSTIQLARAQQLHSSNPDLPLIFRSGDALHLPLEQEEWNTFDIVFSRFLLEHIPTPKLVLEQMKQAAKLGGRIVIADDDHATFTPTPEPPGFATAWKAFLRSYDRIGNDPFIGRRLVTLLHDLGCQDIHNTLIFFGGNASQPQFTAVAHNLIGNLESAKDAMLTYDLLDEDTYNTALHQLAIWKAKPDAALWYGMCWADGKKT